MSFRMFAVIGFVLGMSLLLMPVYDQLVPIEPSEGTGTVGIEADGTVHLIGMPVEHSVYPLTRCGHPMDMYRFCQPDGCISELAERIDSYLDTTDGDRQSDRLYAAWELAHGIDYRTDADSHGRREYWQLPCETLRLGTGDCEDRVFLMVAILQAWGFDCVLVKEPDHLSAGVAIDRDGNTVSYHGREYLAVDPSSSRSVGMTEPDVEMVMDAGGWNTEQTVFFAIDAVMMIILAVATVFLFRV